MIVSRSKAISSTICSLSIVQMVNEMVYEQRRLRKMNSLAGSAPLTFRNAKNIIEMSREEGKRWLRPGDLKARIPV